MTKWGGEDYHIFGAVELANLGIVKLSVPELLHLYHTHVKAWDVSADVSAAESASLRLCLALCSSFREPRAL